MASFSTLYPRLQTEALGAPPALMDLKIRDAARQFMREVPAWRVDHANIAIVTDQADYALTAPADSEIVRVLYASLQTTGQDKGMPLSPAPEAMLRRDWQELDGRPTGFMTPKFNTMTVLPRPDSNVVGNITRINLQLRPSRTTTIIDDNVLNRWEEEIMIGAVWLMYDMQDQPWTNKAEARRYKLRFVKSWTDARRELDKGFTRSDLRVKIPRL
jgi:hypothetical protein